MDENNLDIYKNHILNFINIENLDFIKHLVQLAFLENNNKYMTKDEIIESITRISKLKITDEMKVVLNKLLKDGILIHYYVNNQKDGTYIINSKEFLSLNNFMDNIAKLKSKFESDFINFFSKQNEISKAFNEIPLDMIKNHLEKILCEFFYENGVETFKKINNESCEGFEEENFELKEIVQVHLKQYNLSMYELSCLIKSISEFLLQIENGNLEYITKILEKTFFIRIFNQFNLKSNKKFIEKKIFYLDANVLIALVISNHNRNSEIKHIIKICNHLSISLKITGETLKEYKRQFEYAKKIDKNLTTSNIKGLPNLYNLLSKNEVDNDIFKFYILNKKSYKDFKSFSSTYCDNIYSILDIYKIKCDEVNQEVYDKFKNLEEYNELFSKLRDFKTKLTYTPNDLVVEHDLCNLFLINYLRELSGNEIDNLGPQIWFLTLEKKIEKFRYNNRRIFNTPIWMYIDELYDFLLPFIFEENNLDKDYVRYQISTNLGLYSHQGSYIKLDILGCILNSGFDYKLFEDLDESEVIKLIYSIQSNKKIQHICENNIETPESYQETAQSYIEYLEALLQDELKKVQHNIEKKEIQVLSEKLMEKEKEIENLAKNKEEEIITIIQAKDAEVQLFTKAKDEELEMVTNLKDEEISILLKFKEDFLKIQEQILAEDQLSQWQKLKRELINLLRWIFNFKHL